MQPKIQLMSGKVLDFQDPKPDQFTIEDIALGLSRQPRFGGHTKSFYSVAQHCITLSQVVPNGYKMQALMHDASEAFMGDLPTPLKHLLPEYMGIEEEVSDAIQEAFGFSTMSPLVEVADARMLITERNALLPSLDVLDWEEHKPYPIRINPMPMDKAYGEFLKIYHRLKRDELCGS